MSKNSYKHAVLNSQIYIFQDKPKEDPSLKFKKDNKEDFKKKKKDYVR